MAPRCWGQWGSSYELWLKSTCLNHFWKRSPLLVVIVLFVWSWFMRTYHTFVPSARWLATRLTVHRQANILAKDKADKGKEKSKDKGKEKVTSGEMEPLPTDKPHEEWQIKVDRRRRKRANVPVGNKALGQNRYEVLWDQQEEQVGPKIVDILDKVTVPVKEGDGPNDQVVVANVDQRLVSLERRMLADKVVEQVVSDMRKVTPTADRVKDGLSIVNNKLAQAAEMGAKPMDFVVTKGGSETFEAMNRVARRSWADVVDSDSEAEDLSGDSPPE